MADRPPRLVIVGAGMAGVGTAIRLKQSGFHDFQLLERAPSLGGVWRDNTYPGCACDVESHLYEWSFAPNPGWSHRYSPQPEILRYVEDCASRFGVLPHIRFGRTVERIAWDRDAARWQITTAGGTVEAPVVVAAAGPLSEPRMPALPGLTEFRGALFHSARWNPAVALKGKRIAVLGTGASAAQFIPRIQPLAARLTVYQRTPAWVIPRDDHAYSDAVRAVLRRVPLAQRALREAINARHEMLGIGFRRPAVMRLLSGIAERHLRRSVADPALRARLRPGYLPGCKRIILSDDYLEALTRPNVEVVSGAARALTKGGVVGGDGIERPADVVICGTGFQVTEFPIAGLVVGPAGKTLREAWGPSPQAHLGTTVAGFPNLFLLSGPGTGLGHSSVLLMLEAQIEHLVAALSYMARHGVTALEPDPEAQQRFVAELDRRMAGTVWVTGGCRSWYLDETGRNSTLWPGSVAQFRRRVSPFRPREYLMQHG